MPPDRLVGLTAERGGAALDAEFDGFFRAQLRPLIALAYALTGVRSTSEDLAQEALFAAFNSWTRVRDLENPGAWVRRVIANRAVSSIRRRVVEAAGSTMRGSPESTPPIPKSPVAESTYPRR